MSYHASTYHKEHARWVNPLDSHENAKEDNTRNYMQHLVGTHYKKGIKYSNCDVCEAVTEHINFDVSKDAIQDSAVNNRLVSGVLIDCIICVQCDGGRLPC